MWQRRPTYDLTLVIPELATGITRQQHCVVLINYLIVLASDHLFRKSLLTQIAYIDLCSKSLFSDFRSYGTHFLYVIQDVLR